MRWFWGGRIQTMRGDARASLTTSHQQLEEAIKGREEAVAIGDRLRDIREKNHFAQAIENSLRGAQHA